MPDPTPSRPSRGSPWGGRSKTAALYIVLALLAVALVQMMNGQRRALEEFTFTEFSRQLEGATSRA